MGKYSAIWGNGVIFEDKSNPEHFFITILVKTNSRQNRIFIDEKKLCVEINAPPVKGKANSAIIKLLSKTLNIPKSEINLIKGQTSHQDKRG